MTTYYVQPGHGGSNSGTQANPWTDIQTAFDTATAGGIVYCYGSQTISAQLDLDTNTGTYNEFIVFIGVNSSWVNDGTKFTIDADDTAARCIDPDNKDFIIFENFEFKNATDDAVSSDTSTSSPVHFINCSFHDCGRHGFFSNAKISGFFIRCAFYNNGGSGYSTPSLCHFIFCSFHDNSSHGLDAAGYAVSTLFGCLIYDNGGSGANSYYNQGVTIFNVIDGNSADGISINSAAAAFGFFGFNRTTNHSNAGSVAIDFNSRFLMLLANYFQGNTSLFEDSSIEKNILINGVDLSDSENGDTNSGYTSLTDGSEDFNIRTDASLRRTAITVPLV